jgi:hypothetical protein
MLGASDSGAAVTRAVILQVVIVAALIAWFKLGLPRLERAGAASAAAKREIGIKDLFQSMVVEDPNRQLLLPPPNGDGAAHPERLRMFPSIEEVKQALGPADGFSGDFRGGTHLIWTGTTHKLEASFNKGRLYCLRLEDLRTGHGALVFESSESWQAF